MPAPVIPIRRIELSGLRLPNDSSLPRYTATVFRHRSLHRCATVFLAVVSLLFGQLAMARYVCPGQAEVNAMAAMAEMMAAGQPCEGMDPDQPTLCHQHAAGSAQSFESAKVHAPSMPAVVQVLVVPLVLESQRESVLPVAVAFDERPPPNPLFLSTLRLRV